MNWKPTNPKDAVGIKKAYVSVIPWGVIYELGLAMLEGALKYGRHNYRKDGVRASTYVDAVNRHLNLQFWDMGEDVDAESGVSHITKAIACLVVLRDSMLLGNWTDDRPPSIPPDTLRIMNEKAAALLEKYPNPVPAHTKQNEEN